MAREIITTIWCDICLAEDDVKREAEELPPVSIGGRPARAVAACSDHRPGFDRVFRTVEDLGVTIDNSSPAKSVRPRDEPSGMEGDRCPECGNAYASMQSLRGHCRTVHRMTLGELRVKHGIPHSFKHVPLEPATKRADCPECGEVFEFPRTRRPTQALGVHRRAKHGVLGAKATAPDEAFAGL